MAWDCIIVGAGSAGCAAAYPLVQAGKTVLLLESGGSDRSPFIRIPAAVWRLRPQHDWGYRAQPDPTRHGAAEAWHRGRVLGGTSSINGMLYVRGAAGDYDRWAQLCGQVGGWSAREVMPIFRELECLDQEAVLRGTQGPLYLRTVRRPHAITRAFVESARAAGQPLNPDYNGASQEGVGYLQFTQRRGLRWSAADAFIRPLLGRRNLQLRLGATVRKIEFVQGRATAVVFEQGGRLQRESAREVILSAGAINSPLLLMRSGIGDADELERHKLEVVVDRPEVGRNLREHPLVQLTYRTRIATHNLTQGILQKLAIAASYLRFQEGPIAAAYEAAAFLKTVPSAEVPDVQVFFAPIGWGVVNGSAQLSPYPAIKCVIVRSHAVSSGRVRLSSGDPDSPPVIECRLLESAEDVATLVRGIEAVRAIINTDPIAKLIESEVTPGATEAGISLDVAEFVRSHTEPSCHPMGTCRMGVDADAVVDPELRVRGTENLWIADASIMPDAISANLNAPCMMIGAKLGRQLVAKGR